MGFFYICFFHNRSGLRKNIYIFSSANSFLIWNLAGGNCFTRRFLYKSTDANIWSETLATRGPQIINFSQKIEKNILYSPNVWEAIKISNLVTFLKIKESTFFNDLDFIYSRIVMFICFNCSYSEWTE